MSRYHASGRQYDRERPVIEEIRNSPDRGPMSVEQIERELGRLRVNDDGTLVSGRAS